jgi:putative mRNA 3-end processing factor
VLSHPKVAEMTDACRAAGVDLPAPVVFEGFAGAGQAVVCPPNAVGAKILKGLKRARTAMLTGWALHMTLRNGDRNAQSKPIALRLG